MASTGVSVEMFAWAERNSVAMATHRLPDQAESLSSRMSEMPGTGYLRGLPWAGPGATNNLTPTGEGATSLHPLVHSHIHSTHTSQLPRGPGQPRGCGDPLSPVTQGAHSVEGDGVHADRWEGKGVHRAVETVVGGASSEEGS